MGFHPELPEEEEEATGAVCVCVSTVLSVSLDQCDQLHISVYLHIVCISIVNTCSVSLLVGPGNTELWQTHLYWATRFGSS